MGMFSSKKKYKTNVTVQAIFEESQLPNSPVSGLVKGILNNGDLTSYMMEDVVTSMGIRAETGMLNAKKQGYDVGIPSSGVKTYISGKAAVIAAIQSNIGQAITPEYYYMGPLNSMHFGWQHCHNALGYNPQTNELVGLTNSTGFKCYLADMKATYLKEDFDWMVENNDMGMLAQMGPSPTSGFTPSKPFNTLQGMGQYAAQPPYEVSSVSTEDYVTITYEFQDANGGIVQRGITVSMAAFDNIADFHMCRYRAANGTIGFFTYQNGTGTYPAIDAAMMLEHSSLGTYYPWTYFRRGKMSIKAIESEETIEQMTRWCEYLGVNFETIYDGVHQDPEADLTVQQVMMLFAINPGGQSQPELEYLHKYFTALHQNSLGQQELTEGLYQQMQAYTSSPSQVQRVQDARFAMSFQYGGITSERVSGSIGKIGTYTGHYALVDQNQQQYLTQGNNGVGVGATIPAQPCWIYRRQVLPSTYEEVKVYNLTVNYEVVEQKGFAAGRQDKELLIPLDGAVVRTMSVVAREQLLCRCLNMLVNTVIVEKTPWYASGPFKIVMIVVVVIIIIYSAGTAWQSAALLGTAGTITAISMAILTYVVKALVISFAVKLFVKMVGPEIGFIVAIAAIAYGGYTAATATGPSTWGEVLLSVGSNLVAESNAAVATELGNIYQEISDFQSWALGEYDTIAEARSGLGLNEPVPGLEAIDVVKMGPMFVWGESPNALYDRTVHSGNIGAVSFDMADNFVTSMLQLPTINQVDGDFNYGTV